ncbi:hypothetical protein TrVE_jg184 [Triparma verrucosa]|uniref:NACHT domain-containing protein n=1 Tax=Triparma verrucosa TaxID=1606542 RepID=A0A9W7B161_9STRA|nr:hypothetical protein TrVE_jg184 [Triparma verrucosa]
MSSSAPSSTLTSQSFVTCNGASHPILGSIYTTTEYMEQQIGQISKSDTSKFDKVKTIVAEVGSMLMNFDSRDVDEETLAKFNSLKERVEKVSGHVNKWLTKSRFSKMALGSKWTGKFGEDLTAVRTLLSTIPSSPGTRATASAGKTQPEAEIPLATVLPSPVQKEEEDEEEETLKPPAAPTPTPTSTPTPSKTPTSSSSNLTPEALSISLALQRWRVASPAKPLVLLNPPESSRTYSPPENPSHPLSVLGSKGEWKVTSPNKDRSISLSFPALCKVTHVVLQCGTLTRNFSGWVQKINVQYSTSKELPKDDGWSDLGVDLSTECQADPAMEFPVPLRVPKWMRHVKITPVKWRIAGLLASRENLEPYITMRCAVLAEARKCDTVEETEDVDNGSDAALKRTREGIKDMADAPQVVPLVNFSKNVDVVSNRWTKLGGMGKGIYKNKPKNLKEATKESHGTLRLLRQRKDEGETDWFDLSPPVGRLYPNFKPGDCVNTPLGVGVISSVDPETMECTIYLSNNGKTEKMCITPEAAPIGAFDFDSKKFNIKGMDSFVDMMKDIPAPSEPSLASRLVFNDDWFNVDEFTFKAFEYVLVVGDQAESYLVVQSDAVSYGWGAGARVSISSANKAELATGTIVSHCQKSGGAIVAVDNTQTLSQFKNWSRIHFENQARGEPHPIRVKATAQDIVRSPRIRYEKGAKVMVMRAGAYVDAEVLDFCGSLNGNRHSLKYAGVEEIALVDLNEINHAVSRFSTVEELAEVRRDYLEHVVAVGSEVEDAITGKRLKIEDQLLNISMATGDDAMKVSGEEISRFDSRDLVWKTETDLSPGDRVRLTAATKFPSGDTYEKHSEGTVGFKNEDKAPLQLSPDRENPKFICGRSVNGRLCGGSDGKGKPCSSCASFFEAEKERLITNLDQRTPFVHHVELHANSGGKESGEKDTKNKLLLSHELEKASPMSGVHVEAWNGCAFREGDIVSIDEDGKVHHKKTGKEVPLKFAYKPMMLSTLQNARTTTTTEINGNVARRFNGQGGACIASEPLVFVNGEASFEVVIKKMKGSEDEGLECGVTTTRPEDIDLSYDYASTHVPSWLSSDSGSFWKDGRSVYDAGQWKHLRPVNLKAGDVVTFTVMGNGGIRIECNGVLQVVWDKARVNTSKPLYAFFGMRAPLCGISVRRKEYDITKVELPTGTRSITLKGIEGKTGEIIDLSKHGRPRYPAAFENVRAISDIHSLYPLLVQPWPARSQGRKDAQPVLIRAGPGTGKTWCVMQLLYFLAKGSDKLEVEERRKHIIQGFGTRCLYLTHNVLQHAVRLELTPYVIYVQKLARLMNKSAENGGEMATDDLVRFYMKAEFEEREKENSLVKDEKTLDMLLQLYESRLLIILIDGIDEAASLKEVVEDYITQSLVPAGHQIIVTSRPEGVRLRLYKSFVVMNLTKLSEEQQNNAISAQLEKSKFYEHLSAFSTIRKEHDKKYTGEAFAMESQRSELEGIKTIDLFRLSSGSGWNGEMRNRNIDNEIIKRRPDGVVNSEFLKGLDAGMGPHLVVVDQVIEAGSDGDEGWLPDEATQEALEKVKAWETEDEKRHLDILKKLALYVVKKTRITKKKWTAVELWPEIMAATDEMYELNERCIDDFGLVIRHILREDCDGADQFKSGEYSGFMAAPLKDPVRTHEKAHDKFAGRFSDEIPEACVPDIIRSRVIFDEAKDLIKLVQTLLKGYRWEKDGKVFKLELIRCNNKFRSTDPTHFRFVHFNMMLKIEGPGGETICCQGEVQIHHFLILKYNDESNAHHHYEFFRSHLRSSYETALDSNLDFMLEKRMKVFDELGSVPVLLSLLILCLSSQDSGEENVNLPEDIYELYIFAINGVLKRETAGNVETATRMLRRIATANHLQQRRFFLLKEVRDALAGHDDELSLWMQLMRRGSFPLVKVLASDGETSGEFQFKHLSFQEALFVEAVRRDEAPSFWDSTAKATENLNHAFYKNAFAIGAGYLGNALAKQKPYWDFSKEEQLEMDDVHSGWSRLQTLLRNATRLVSLKLPLSTKAEDEMLSSGDGATSMKKTRVPTNLNRDFRSARVEGVLGGARARKMIYNGKIGTQEGEREPVVSTVGDWVELDGVVSARLPESWFTNERGIVGVDIGYEGEEVMVKADASITFDQGEDTPKLLAALEFVSTNLDGQGAADEKLCKVLVETAALGFPALARHTGSADVVDELVRVHPRIIGKHALLANMERGLLHNASRLVFLKGEGKERCLNDEDLGGVVEQLIKDGRWEAIAIDDSQSAVKLVDELIKRVPAAKDTVESLLLAALRSGKKAKVSLRFAKQHWPPPNPIDVVSLLEETEDDEHAAAETGGDGDGDGDGEEDEERANVKISQWSKIALRKTKNKKEETEVLELVDHMLWRVPELTMKLTDLCISAVRARRYEVVRKLIVGCGAHKMKDIWDGPKFLKAMLKPTERLPWELYGKAGGKGGDSSGGGIKSRIEGFLNKDSTLGNGMKAALRKRQTPWTLMLLDEKNQVASLELASAYPELYEALVSPSVLMLAMVPKLSDVAYWLLCQGEDYAAKKKGGRGYAQFDDNGLISALLEPANNDSSAWLALQLDEDSSKLVNHVMVNVPALGSLDIFLTKKHAGRAADLLESDARLSDAEVAALLEDSMDESEIKKMTWDQAICSAGAIVHESPHPHPKNGEITESFTVPGAKKFFIGFHEETNCHRNRSVVRIYKRGEEDGEALWEGSGIASKFPGGKNPPLVVHGDSFSVTFLSRNAPGTDWGYRLVAWSSGPKGWCRFAELMLSESKEAGRLCMALIKLRTEFKAHAEGPMIELSLVTAAKNSQHANAALEVLARAGIASGKDLSSDIVDTLLEVGGSQASSKSLWHMLVVANASPKLNDLLMEHSRLLKAIENKDLLLETMTFAAGVKVDMKRVNAAMKLLSKLPVFPDGLIAEISEPKGEGEESRWTSMTRSDKCFKLVKALLARDPSLGESALSSVLVPGWTHIFDRLMRLGGVEVTEQTISAMIADGRWDELVLTAPWPYIERLAAGYAELKTGMLRSEMLLKSMTSAATCEIGTKLIERGCDFGESVKETLLKAPSKGKEKAAAGQEEDECILVKDDSEGFAFPEICGLYRSSNVEVMGGVLKTISGKREDRRCVYYQIGGQFCIWFKILEEEEEEEEKEEEEDDDFGGGEEGSDGEDFGGGNGDDDDDGSNFGGGEEDEEEGNEEEDKLCAEAEDPEDQDGTWVITHVNALEKKGGKGVDKTSEESRIFASVAETALQPHKISLSLWSVSSLKPRALSNNAVGYLMTSTPTFRVQTSSNSMVPFNSKTRLLNSLILNSACWPFVEKLTELDPSLRPHCAILALEMSKNSAISGSAIFPVDESSLPLMLEEEGKHWLNVMSKPWNFNKACELMGVFASLRDSALEHVKKFVTVETARMGRHLISLPECELKLDDYRFYGEFFKCVRARYMNREDEKRKGDPQEVDLLVDDLVAKVEGLEAVVADLEARIKTELQEKKERKAAQWEYLNEQHAGIVQHLRKPQFDISDLNGYLRQNGMVEVTDHEEAILRAGLHLAANQGGDASWLDEEWNAAAGGEEDEGESEEFGSDSDY